MYGQLYETVCCSKYIKYSGVSFSSVASGLLFWKSMFGFLFMLYPCTFHLCFVLLLSLFLRNIIRFLWFLFDELNADSAVSSCVSVCIRNPYSLTGHLTVMGRPHRFCIKCWFDELNDVLPIIAIPLGSRSGSLIIFPYTTAANDICLHVTDAALAEVTNTTITARIYYVYRSAVG